MKSLYRFRVIAEDEENYPNGPFNVEYYQGSILGGRWIALSSRKHPNRIFRFEFIKEAEQFKDLFTGEGKNPQVLDFFLKVQRGKKKAVEN